MIMKLLQGICVRKVTNLRDKREGIRKFMEQYYPIGSFGYERCTLAIAFTDSKITIWQAFMGET